MDIPVGTRVRFDRRRRKTYIIDPYDQKSIEESFRPEQPLPCPIPPKRRALLSSAEPIKYPPSKWPERALQRVLGALGWHVLGFVELRSTWARLGLVAPPTYVDAGFYGHLTLEVFNAGESAVLVRPGDLIWSVVQVCSRERVYAGRYQGQVGLQLPKALEDSADATT